MFLKVGDPSPISETSASNWSEAAPPKKFEVTWTFEQVLAASLEYFQGDELAANTWTTKYALQAGQGNFLEKTPTDMHWRLAREFARIEAKYPNPMTAAEIFGLFDRFKTVVPQGSPMSAIGNPYFLQSLGNCFALPPVIDSYGGILHTDQQLAQLMKRRAGVGVDVSGIRPKGMPTTNAAVTTDGIGVFMQRFSNTCREVAQNGRRGAEMITCSITHPEIRTFINVKKDRTKVTGANISVRITDSFMYAVEGGGTYTLQWPIEAEPKTTQEVDAGELWHELILNAWDSAEPGILFWDNIIRNSLPDLYSGRDARFKTTTTNPCGEIPLGVDACRLLLLNLMGFVEDAFTAKARMNWALFDRVAYKAQRLMDDIVDLEVEQITKILEKIDQDPEPEPIKQVERSLWENFRETTLIGRRTGLGITAMGDMLAALGIVYGSPESVEWVEQVYRRMALAAHHASADMAKERGAFPLYDYALEEAADCPYLTRLWEAEPTLREKHKAHGRRNIALTTTAPAGSVSLLTQTSSGIEPVFMLEYNRRKKINSADTTATVDSVDALGDRWQVYKVYHHGLAQWVGQNPNRPIQDSPYWGATANELDWNVRVKIQAAAQRWLSHSISSTINLPKDVSVDVVKELYTRAWKEGCKGLTIYREGCRDGVLVKAEKKDLFPQHPTPTRPERLPCEVHRAKIRNQTHSPDGPTHEEWIIFVGLFEGKPYEIFGGTTENITLPKKVETGTILKRPLKNGSKYDFTYGDEDDPLVIKDFVRVFDNPDRGWATRMISLSLRHGAPVQYVVEQLQRDKESDLFDFARVIARVLKKYIPDGVAGSSSCPVCSAIESMRYQEGCLSCGSCGYGRC